MVLRCWSFAAIGRGKVRAVDEAGEVNALCEAVANRAVNGRRADMVTV